MKKWAYYNERDPQAAQWIRNLMDAGHIAPGIVDERSISDVSPDDVRSFIQCHWFAGIAVWSHALRRAGWPDDRPVWTGSCPCQPFSAAGRGDGFADERHLWPHWHWLIAQCRPRVVLGEQVASKDGLGWNDLVSADLEGTGYAFGSVDICAAGLAVEGWEQSQAGQWLRGAIYHCADPEIRRSLCDFADWAGAGNLGDGGHHLRQRQYFVAVADADGKNRRAGLCYGQSTRNRIATAACRGGNDELADALPAGRPERGTVAGDRPTAGSSTAVGMVDGIKPRLEGLAGDGDQCDQPGRLGADAARPVAEAGSDGGVGDYKGERKCADKSGRNSRHRVVVARTEPRRHSCDNGADAEQNSTTDAPDSGRGAPDWLFCRDGVWRPVGPGSFPLAHAAPARVVRLRAYGNALDAQTATSFVEAVIDVLAMPDLTFTQKETIA